MKKRNIKFKKNKYKYVMLTGIELNIDSLEEISKIVSDSLRNNKILEAGQLEYTFTQLDPVHNELDILDGSKTITKILSVQINNYYFEPGDLIAINNNAQKIFVEDGVYGIQGVKEPGQLDYICNRLKNSYMFDKDTLPTLLDKAVFLWMRLAKNQSFQNGNKRTALLAMSLYLYMNYVNLSSSLSLLNIYEQYSIMIAKDEIGADELKKFLSKNISYDFDRSSEDYINYVLLS